MKVKGEKVTFEVTRKAETDSAMLFYFHEEDVDHWIPTSQIDSTHLKGGVGTVVMSCWIAKQKGLL